MKKHKHKSIRMYKSDFLEKQSHVHPLTPLFVWIPIISYLLYVAVAKENVPVSSIYLYAIPGILTWTLAEYLLHRFLFHIPVIGPFTKRFHFMIHGVHHEDPIDPTRLVMPPIPGIAIAVPLYFMFSLIMGSVHVKPFFAFFLIGYLCYDYIHFYTHHFTPKSKILKTLKYNHMQHHFVDPKTNLGISTPLWDHVFGTFKTYKSKRKSYSSLDANSA